MKIHFKNSLAPSFYENVNPQHEKIGFTHHDKFKFITKIHALYMYCSLYFMVLSCVWTEFRLENRSKCWSYLNFLKFFKQTEFSWLSDVRHRHDSLTAYKYSVFLKSGAIGEHLFGSIWKNIIRESCCKLCASNLKCWQFLHRTSHYGAALFK